MNKRWWIVLIVVIVIIVGLVYFVGNGYDYTSREDSGSGVESGVEAGLYPAGENLGGFCGSSTKGVCETDEDCVVSGCSNQVCQSVNEELIVTTCGFLDCYDPDVYVVSCGCVNNECQWGSEPVY
jgi:eight-cysteine-cluster-containing protein